MDVPERIWSFFIKLLILSSIHLTVVNYSLCAAWYQMTHGPELDCSPGVGNCCFTSFNTCPDSFFCADLLSLYVCCRAKTLECRCTRSWSRSPMSSTRWVQGPLFRSATFSSSLLTSSFEKQKSQSGPTGGCRFASSAANPPPSPRPTGRFYALLRRRREKHLHPSFQLGTDGSVGLKGKVFLPPVGLPASSAVCAAEVLCCSSCTLSSFFCHCTYDNTHYHRTYLLSLNQQPCVELFNYNYLTTL